jgi:hypothetical protein
VNKDKTCKTCLKGKPIELNGDILCSIHGIVGPDYSCKKHRAIPQNALKINPLTCADCNYYKISKEISEEHLGVCRLFTERKYNGKLRRACSKIDMKSDQWEMDEEYNAENQEKENEKLKPILAVKSDPKSDAKKESKKNSRKESRRNRKLKLLLHGKGS